MAERRGLDDTSTRGRIHRYLFDVGRPADVEQVVAAVGVHHNSVRRHLERLCEQGLVRKVSEARVAPGRPRHLYIGIASEADAVELTARLLAEAVRRHLTPREVGRSAGARTATEHAGELTGSEAIAHEAMRLGFEPCIEQATGDTRLVLRHCPLHAIASAEPSAVCALHLGLLEGVAAAHPGTTVTGLDVFDPDNAGCVVHVTLDGAPTT